MDLLSIEDKSMPVWSGEVAHRSGPMLIPSEEKKN